MSELKREFGFGLGISIAWVILAIIALIFKLFYMGFPIIFGFIFLFMGCYGIIMTQHAKSRYQQYPSDELCDICCAIVEKIKLRNYGPAKVLLCKKCYEKELKINTIFTEILILLLLAYFLTFYPSNDIFFFIQFLKPSPFNNPLFIAIIIIVFIGLAIMDPLIYLIRIRRY